MHAPSPLQGPVNDDGLSHSIEPSREETRTRWTMIRKLTGAECDEATWSEFDRIYRKQVYAVARKMGLTHEESQDAVQETMVAVFDQIQEFKPDPTLGSFRSWLFQGARWRIVAQFRKRQRKRLELQSNGDDTTGTPHLERVPDLTSETVEESLHAQWQREMLDAAAKRVKDKVSPDQFQIFDLHVLQGLPVLKVAHTLGINVPRVYLARHRISKLIKKEVRSFERKLAL